MEKFFKDALLYFGGIITLITIAGLFIACVMLIWFISPYLLLAILLIFLIAYSMAFTETKKYKEIKEKRKILKEERKNKKLSYVKYSDLHSSNFFILGEEDFLEENCIEKSIRTTTKGKTLGVEDSESIWGYFKDEVQLKNNKNKISEERVYSVFENHEDRSRKNGK